MGNVNGTEEGPNACNCGNPNCRNGGGMPAGFMQMMQMLTGRRTNPWETKSQEVCSLIRENNKESVQNALKEFESVTSRAFLVRILIENIEDNTEIRNVVNQVFPDFLRDVQIVTEESDGLPVTKALKACFTANLFKNEIRDRVNTLYQGDVGMEQLPLLASVAVSSVRNVDHDLASSFVSLLLRKIDWDATSNAGAYSILAELLHFAGRDPVLKDIFDQCWTVVESTSRRQDDDGVAFLAITSMIKTLLQQDGVSSDLLLKLFTVLNDMPEDEKKIDSIATCVVYGLKEKNKQFVRSALGFSIFATYPLDGADAIILYSTVLSGRVIVHCGSDEPEDNEMVEKSIRQAFMAATAVNRDDHTDMIVGPISHLIGAHTEFVPYIAQELISMYKSNSVSMQTTGIYSTLAAMILTQGAFQVDLVTDEQATALIQTVLDTPNPWVFQGTKMAIAMMVVPVIALKNRLPELCGRFMDWVRANIEHLKPFEPLLRNCITMLDSKDEEVAAPFREQLTAFLDLF